MQVINSKFSRNEMKLANTEYPDIQDYSKNMMGYSMKSFSFFYFIQQL